MLVLNIYEITSILELILYHVFNKKGEFYSIQTHAEPPFKSKPFMMPNIPGYMLSAGVSEFTLNSAAYGYFTAGKLQILITEKMVSAVMKT